MINNVEPKTIYSKETNGFERWIGYDSRGNINYYKDSKGFIIYKDYDNKDRCIHCLDIYNDYEYWNNYDENGKLIYYKNNRDEETYYDYKEREL